MAKTEEPQTQLATRIPQELHRRLRVYCVTHNLVLMHFVVAAIEERLGRKQRSNTTDWLALGLGDRAVRSDRGSTRRSIGYEGAGMNADRDLTKSRTGHHVAAG